MDWTASEGLSELHSLVRLRLTCAFSSRANRHRRGVLIPQILSVLELQGVPRTILDINASLGDFSRNTSDLSQGLDFVNKQSITEALLSLHHTAPGTTVTFAFVDPYLQRLVPVLAEAIAV